MVRVLVRLVNDNIERLQASISDRVPPFLPTNQTSEPIFVALLAETVRSNFRYPGAYDFKSESTREENQGQRLRHADEDNEFSDQIMPHDAVHLTRSSPRSLWYPGLK